MRPRTPAKTLATAAVVTLAGAAFALGATAGSKQQAAFGYHNIEFTILKSGPIAGVVAAGQRVEGGRMSLTVSLHGLTVGSSYVVAGSAKPCSEAATRESTVYSYTMINTTVSNVFARLTRKARGTKSVRLFDKPATGQLVQKACGKTGSRATEAVTASDDWETPIAR
jgi:hypothetical protein